MMRRWQVVLFAVLSMAPLAATLHASDWLTVIARGEVLIEGAPHSSSSLTVRLQHQQGAAPRPLSDPVLGQAELQGSRFLLVAELQDFGGGAYLYAYDTSAPVRAAIVRDEALLQATASTPPQYILRNVTVELSEPDPADMWVLF